MGGWERIFGATGALFGLLAVGFGAFGAHALRGRLEPRALEIFEMGVRYQMMHALALLLLAAVLARGTSGIGLAAGWCFIAGICVFSGSLYILALTGVGRWGAVTPLGGLAFIAGWLLLLLHFLRG